MSLYQSTVPVFIRALQSMDGQFAKAQAWAAENGTSADDLVEARLAPDMLTLAGQVQRATDAAKLNVFRMTGLAAPAWPDEEKTFAELRARIATAIAWLEAVDAAAFEGSDARPIRMEFPGMSFDFENGGEFLRRFALPNFHFHTAMAYAVLRAQGVPLGKADYLATMMS
ncbi:MAG: DUF1993 domain-containing protein [Pseudomonadota bacterium]